MAKLIKKKRDRNKTNKIISEREVTTNTTEIQRIIKEHYKQLYANKFDFLEEMAVSRSISLSKTESGRNGKYKQTDYYQ